MKHPSARIVGQKSNYSVSANRDAHCVFDRWSVHVSS